METNTLFSRRDFIRATGTAAVAGTILPALAAHKPASEPLVKKLYDTLNKKQRKAVCFAWDYENHNGLLRKHISNNWLITKPLIRSSFFTKEQQDIIRATAWSGVYEGFFWADAVIDKTSGRMQ